MQVNWYFVRHGEIASNNKKVYSGRSNEALTEVGKRQVKDAAICLSESNIDAIFTSPLKRTVQTAEIPKARLSMDMPVHKDSSFNEIIMGPWEGMAEKEIAKQYSRAWAVWNTSPAELSLKGRETLKELQTRVINGMRDIENNNAFNSVLIVTHVAIIRIITLYASDMDLNAYKSIAVDNAQVFKFDSSLKLS